jgi:hypothetical protein
LLQVLLSRYFLSLDVLIMLLLNSIQMFTFKIFLKSKREKALIFVGIRIRYKKQREREIKNNLNSKLIINNHYLHTCLAY